MNRSLPVQMVILLALALLVLGGCSQAPALVVAPTTYDFGDISAAEPVQGRLELRNEGDAPLMITGLSTSCGCTTAEVGEEAIPPGQGTELTVTFNPLAHPGLYGPLMRNVYVTSNDPDSPELAISIHVNVLAPEEKTQ